MMDTTKILIIDDDTELCELLDEYLSDDGFEIEMVHNGEDGCRKVTEESFSLIILDVMLPDINGLEVLKIIRRNSEIPIIMLTARGEEVDRIIGLEVGADDYLPKPFNPRELLARTRSILRRSATENVEKADTKRVVLSLADSITMDLTRRTVHAFEQEINLTSLEFKLLERLVSAEGDIVDRDELYRSVLDREQSPLDRSLDVHLSNLRRKLKQAVGKSKLIVSVRGEGYLFAETIRPI
ncbi:response regulator [Desulfosediminicola ganghwensis]|uniref:response regulator n=1 Tax=Desulfosediminicola ganghwensis TaxID=2569540 RepID=UPI001E5A7054|nr:response regulator transcription factor [Desulfosediminicola ganghwensis]